MGNPERYEEECDGTLEADMVGGLTDRQIREDVLEALATHADLDMSGVEVYVRYGRVTLGGVVDSRGAKLAATAAAEQSPGVTGVRNEIRIDDTDDAIPDAGWDTTDSEANTDGLRLQRRKPQ